MKHSVSSQHLKAIVKNLYKVALDSVNPYKTTLNAVKENNNRIKRINQINPNQLNLLNPVVNIGQYRYDLSQYKNIYVAGSGKAAAGMAKAIEEKLGGFITKGIISIGYGCGTGIKLKRIRINEAGHPLPDKSSVAGAKRIKALLAGATANDLVIYLATGGGSATLAMPAEGLTLKDLRDTSQLLLKSGATLQEINYIRKHIDLVKGGQLARDAYPASIVTIVISDVVGDPIDMVSSGPTVPDPYTFKDAYNVLRKYKLLRKVPKSVRREIEKGLRKLIPETPKKNELYFRKAKAFLVGSNTMAIKAMEQKAKSSGFDVVLNKGPITGEARDAARRHAIKAMHLAKKIKRPLFILSGGETTVTVKGNGLGGRNQEYTLAFLLEMERLGFDRFICLSCSTDGIDYIKDAAGAMVDGTSLKKARRLGLNPERLLNNNDSYHFHKPIGTLVTTGPTGTNVNDVQIIVVW